jgi:Ca-activated chloride channel homolog
VRAHGGSPVFYGVAGLAFVALAASGAVTAPAGVTRARVVFSLDHPSPLPTRQEIGATWGNDPVVVEALRTLTASASPWSLVIYVDAPMTRPEALVRAAGSLTSIADDLVALGEVSLVLADPEPRLLLRPTRQSAELEAALAALERESLATGELAWLRQRYATPGSGSDPFRAAQALLEEETSVREQQERFLLWLQGPAEPAARAVLWVTDGFDLEPELFYSRGLDEPLNTGQRLRRAFEATERGVAGSGWRVLPVALGHESGGLLEPYEPLERLARATGGRFASSPRGLRRALDALNLRIELDLALPQRVSADGAEEPRALRIEWPKGTEVSGPHWLTLREPGKVGPEVRRAALALSPGLAEGKVIRLVPPPRVDGAAVQVAVLSTRPEIASVEFSLDGRPLATAGPPPLEVRVGLDPAKGAVRLEARAYSASGELLGEDRLLLNTSDERAPHLEIASLSQDRQSGSLEITAALELPPARRVLGVDFFWNEILAASLEEEPFRATLDAGPPRPGDFARVVARLDDGSVLEAARFAREGDAVGALEVNLIEVYALVRARRQIPAGLARADFSLYQGGRRQDIEEFARAADLPLELGLAIDTSSSMEPWMDMVRRAATRFLETVLRPGDEGFLVDFDQRPRLAHAPTSDRESLIRRFGALRAYGQTSLYDSILFSLLQFDAPRARRALVVLSDGADSDSHFRPKDCIEQARAAGVPIYIISLGDPPDLQRDPLRLLNNRLAQATGGEVYNVSDAHHLDEIYERIADDLANHYLLTFSTDRTLSRSEMENIRVEMRDPRLTVRTLVNEGSR